MIRLPIVFSVLLVTFSTFALAQMPNNITNNGIGSSPTQRHYVSSCQAQSILLAAQSAAAVLDVSDNIAVLDLSGYLVGFLRMDNAFLGGIDLSIKKAKTVVLFNGLTSTELYPASLPNGTLYGERFFFAAAPVQSIVQQHVPQYVFRNDDGRDDALSNATTNTEEAPKLTNMPSSGIQETNGGLVVFPGGLPLFQNDQLVGAIGVSGGTVAQDVGVAQAGVDHFVNSDYAC